MGGTYGETVLSGQNAEVTAPIVVDEYGAGQGDGKNRKTSPGRTRRSVQTNGTNSRNQRRNHIDGYNALDEMEDESDATTSGGEWDAGDDDDVDEHVANDEEDEDVDMSDDGPSAEEDEDYAGQQSLVVSLRYHKRHGGEDTRDSIKVDRNLDARLIDTSIDSPVLLKSERIANGQVPLASNHPLLPPLSKAADLPMPIDSVTTHHNGQLHDLANGLSPVSSQPIESSFQPADKDRSRDQDASTHTL